MPCAKVDALPVEDPAPVGGRVAPISTRLRQRPSCPDTGYELGLDAKEAGSMMARRRREGGMWEQKTRKSTDKNGVFDQGHTVDEEKN